MSGLVEDLMRPEAYPPPLPSGVDLVRTHISLVFLTDREAWKVKRPVDLGFLDFSTPEKRERACHEEVRLNRRLAPSVYLGVLPVRRGPGGHTFAGPGEIVDFAVRMRRLPEGGSARAMLRAGALDHGHLERLADFMADFYRAAPEVPAFGDPAVIAGNLRENFEQVEPFVGRFVERETFDRVRSWQEGFVGRHRDLLEGRVRAGRIRDGHGDLRLEHCHFPRNGGDPLVIDAIEFNERFRCGDAASDAAFLAMELDAEARPDLAARFVARFARASQDYDLYPVLDLYLGYRAWVRGKVACFVAADRGTDPGKARRKAAEARRLFALAARYAARDRAPGPLVAVGGVIGTGKSTLAREISRLLGLPVVSSDATRKHLAGFPQDQRGGACMYTEAFTRLTYAEVLRRAGAVLGSGRGAVIDATFRSREHRGRARALAERLGAPFLFVESRCDPHRLRERLRARRPSAAFGSDADEALLDRFWREFEEVDELPPGEHLVLESDRPAADLAARVEERVGTGRRGAVVGNDGAGR